MRRTLALATALVVIVGCGQDSATSNHEAARPKAPAPQRPGSPLPGDPPDATYGGLSLKEKRTIVHEYRVLASVRKHIDEPGSLERARRACAAVIRPRTLLISEVREDCDNTLYYWRALRRLGNVGTECTTGVPVDRASCVSEAYNVVRITLEQSIGGTERLNRELLRRGITGLCARSIGTTDAQDISSQRVMNAARDASNAVATGNRAAFQRANDDLQDALNALAGGEDPLRGIERGCHALKPRSRDGGVNA